MKNNSKTRFTMIYIAQAGVIAALYVVLTIFISAFNLASGAIQVRISEALCILPYFTGAAVPGLTIGCFLANLFVGGSIWDMIFGTLATFLGAVFSRMLRKNRFLVTLPPVVFNALIIPFVLYYGYGFTWAWEAGGMDLSILFYVLTVGAGEVLSVCGLGSLLLHVLLPVRKHLFPEYESAAGSKMTV